MYFKHHRKDTKTQRCPACPAFIVLSSLCALCLFLYSYPFFLNPHLSLQQIRHVAYSQDNMVHSGLEEGRDGGKVLNVNQLQSMSPPWLTWCSTHAY